MVFQGSGERTRSEEFGPVNQQLKMWLILGAIFLSYILCVSWQIGQLYITHLTFHQIVMMSLYRPRV